MSLPELDSHGDLPEGVHHASLEEVVERFGHGTPQRQLATASLMRIDELARQTSKLERCVIFGSYVTANPAPNDVDIILIMRDDFRQEDYTEEVLPVFDHWRAQHELRASVFWTRPGAVLLETVDEFIAHWQVKRDHTRHGIVEIFLE